MKHNVKSWPESFEPVWLKKKSFEIRKNDRFYQVGDILTLEEFEPMKGAYTGRHVCVEITYILGGKLAENFGLQSGYVAMTIDEISRS